MSLRRHLRKFRLVRRAMRRAKNAISYRTALLVIAIVRAIPFDRALRVADRAGDLTYFVLRPTRRLSRKHVEWALGDAVPPRMREQIVRASFRNIARSFVEVIHFDEIRKRADYVQVDGWENYERAAAKQVGVIAITGHIGNWELLAAYFAQRGLPVAAIARRLYEPRLNALIVEFRGRNGVQTILRETPGSSREMLRILKERGVLAMLIDQDTKVPSVSVPFFGRMARTPAGAAALAIRRGIPILPVFAQRRPEGGHRIVIEPPLQYESTGDRRRDVIRMTQLCSSAIEERIRKNPAEWVWWHRRWRRGPVPKLDLDI